MKFIHLSDLHFHSHAKDNKEAKKVLKFVQDNYASHYLIVTGDIVDDGHELQYDEALKALKPFKGRVFICPGNHDFGGAGNFFSRERAERFDHCLSRPLEQGGTFSGDQTPVVNFVEENRETVMLIAMDTNLETSHPFDFACGEVGETQLSYLDSLLSSPATASLTKILFFHHHPFMHGNPFMELTDARSLMRTLFSRIQVMLFGHKHESAYWQNMNGISHVLASDNSPGKEFAREIEIDKGEIRINDIKIS